MPVRQRHLAGAAGLLSATGILAGCGAARPESPPRYSVSGTVTIDGQPLESAVIRFIPLPEVIGPKASVAITAGTFEIPADSGPVAGRHRVEIESSDHGGVAPDDETSLKELAAGKRKPVKPGKIPVIYNTRSTLQRTIQSDFANRFEFTLVTRR
ncbi:MAG TPA: hypothetical protein VM510_02110 [Caulifigura sp.]|nr:hypothetical protein [Caulifigura sp.]